MCHKFMAHPLFSFLRSFFSSDFTDELEAFLLVGLLTDFRGYLASGQWLAPEIFPYCFCHADFADDADFSSWKFFIPQISQIYTDFLHHDFSSSDFTDESEGILACRIAHGFSRNFGRWPMARALYMLLLFWSRRFRRWRRFFFVGGFCPTDFTDIHRFFMESLVNLFVQPQGVSATTGQVASAKFRE